MPYPTEVLRSLPQMQNGTTVSGGRIVHRTEFLRVEISRPVFEIAEQSLRDTREVGDLLLRHDQPRHCPTSARANQLVPDNSISRLGVGFHSNSYDIYHEIWAATGMWLCEKYESVIKSRAEFAWLSVLHAEASGIRGECGRASIGVLTRGSMSVIACLQQLGFQQFGKLNELAMGVRQP